MSNIRAVKGMHDVLPPDSFQWRNLEQTFRRVADSYGYGEVRTPILEPTPLFVRSIGEATDIVEKEMYTFVDKGDDSLTMRPEGTASAIRAYLEHSVHAREPVTKWTYLGPMYRRERPAKGRYRQFYQLGAEIIGDPGPYVDAELIDMVVGFLGEVGVRDIEVLVNSLGGAATRDAYRAALVDFLRPKVDLLSAESQRRLELNPLRVLDSKDPKDIEVVATAPSILELLDPEDREHWDGLRATLDTLGTPYRVEPRLVRGLDYYSRTLFEIRGRGGDLGAQNAICGGGRYDGLVKALGGPATPAIGFAAGLERILLSVPQASATPTLDVFIVVPSPGLRPHALAIARELRSAGMLVDLDLRGTSMKSQMRHADKRGALFVLVYGDSEHEGGIVQLKELKTGEQRPVARAGLAATIRLWKTDGPPQP